MDRAAIVIVSGLPRSGTSMMMQMLAAGGMSVLTDDERAADAANPRGYFEYAPVKRIKDDASWLSEACGKAVKVVSPLLHHLPTVYQYRVILMQRDLNAVLASQRTMLRRGNQPVSEDGSDLAAAFRRHLVLIENWLEPQHNVRVLPVNYGDVLRDPSGESERIGVFLDRPLDHSAMARVVDASLRHA